MCVCVCVRGGAGVVCCVLLQGSTCSAAELSHCAGALAPFPFSYFITQQPLPYSPLALSLSVSLSLSLSALSSMASGGQRALAEEQVRVLEENFTKVTKHPDQTTLMLIAAEAGLTEEETAKWFRKRNAQWRQSEGLPAELGSVKD
uniref:Homeodomain-only protein n=1 Tax=Astyanax mexicanus TaxID=7994 RepID=A0A3B1IKS8_ASTMX